jgi:hypothetical protein
MTTVFRCLLMLSLFAIGCAAEVKTTEDSTKFEVEVPKVEVKDKKPDLNIKTDDDVDIDTPRPGDT